MSSECPTAEHPGRKPIAALQQRLYKAALPITI